MSSRSTIVAQLLLTLAMVAFILVNPMILPTIEAFSMDAPSTSKNTKIRAISFDVTGTLVATREPVIQSYYDAMIWSKLPNPPTQNEMKQAFKTAYKERCIESPCFGGVDNISGRDWWKATVQRVLEHSGRTLHQDFTQEEFDRYFRRVYQHFGSPNGYMVLDDAQQLLDVLSQQQERNDNEDGQQQLLLGITSNTPTRHMESVLPMLNIHDKFQWFTCSQDVKYEKPSYEIFHHAYEQAKFWIPTIQPNEILHIGDSFECDYCGAKAYGFQALLLDRSNNPNVTSYQDWIDAPTYPGKDTDDIASNTITNLMDVATRLAL